MQLIRYSPSPPYTPAPGAVGDGVTDDTAAIQAALDSRAATGGTVLLTQGDYAITQLTIPSSVSLQGLSGVELISLNTTGIPLITLSGTILGSAEVLTANALLGDTTVSVPSTVGFAIDSYVLLRDDTYYNTIDTAARNQQIQRIRSVTANSVTFYTPVNSVFQTSQNAEIIQIAPVADCHVGGLTITIPAGKKGGGVYGFLAVNCAIEDCHVSGCREWPSFRLDTSLNTGFTRCIARDAFNPADTSGGAYGFLMNEGCFDCWVESSLSSGVREDLFSNNTCNCRYINNTVRGNRLGTNTHGSACRDILIACNQIDGNLFDGIVVGSSTAKAADHNITIVGNTIRNCGASGIAVTANVAHNQGILIADNKVIDCGVSSAAQYGILVQKTDKFAVHGNVVRSLAGPNITRSILALTSSDGTIDGNLVTDAPSHGIALNACTRVAVRGNKLYGIVGHVFRDEGGNTLCTAYSNESDTLAVQITDVIAFGNRPAWGTGVDVSALGIAIDKPSPAYALDVQKTVADAVSAGARFANLSDDAASAAIVTVRSGVAGVTSGGLGAFHASYTTSLLRDRISLFANSDSLGLVLLANSTGQDIRFLAGAGGEILRLSSNKIQTNQVAAATTPGTVTGKLALYDLSGTLLGYLPLYDAIT